MHTLKEILTEPQTMYDGGVVGMADGGPPKKEFREGEVILVPTFGSDRRPSIEFSLVTSTGDVPKNLYRYVSPEEWNQIKETGEMMPSDFYKRIHASASPEERYNEKDNVLLEIEYKPEDSWYAKMGDKVYGVTTKKIPISRIKNLTAKPQNKLPVPEEQTPTGTAVVEGAKKLAKGAVKQAIKRIPGASLLNAKPVADATIPGFMTKIVEEKRNKAFENLAWEQRGLPEEAMLELQKAIGGGVLGNLAEHVGDLTHRMSEKFDYLKGSPTSVAYKIKSTLRTLRSDYGFEKEHLENMKTNAEFDNIPEEKFLNRANKKLAKYADEHRKLKVYNEPQKWARDAAVAIGEKNWNRVITELEKLESLIENQDAYEEAVSKFDEDFEERLKTMYDGGIVNMQDGGKPQNKIPVPKVLKTALELGVKKHPVSMIVRALTNRMSEKEIGNIIKILKDTPAHKLFGLKQSGSQSLQKLVNDFTNRLQTQRHLQNVDRLYENVRVDPRRTIRTKLPKAKLMYDGGLV